MPPIALPPVFGGIQLVVLVCELLAALPC